MDTEEDEEVKRYKFLEEVNESYKRLKENKKAWADFQREVKEWDVTLMDGLEED